MPDDYDDYDYDDYNDDLDVAYDDGFEAGRRATLAAVRTRMGAQMGASALGAGQGRQGQRRRLSLGQKRRDAVLVGLVREVRDLRAEVAFHARQGEREARVIDVGPQYPVHYGAAPPVAPPADHTPILLAGLAIAAASLVVAVMARRD